MQYLLLIHGSSGCVNDRQRYVCTYIACLDAKLINNVVYFSPQVNGLEVFRIASVLYLRFAREMIERLFAACDDYAGDVAGDGVLRCNGMNLRACVTLQTAFFIASRSDHGTNFAKWGVCSG